MVRNHFLNFIKKLSPYVHIITSSGEEIHFVLIIIMLKENMYSRVDIIYYFVLNVSVNSNL